MKRQDIHRPSAINPVDYQYVGQEVIKIECPWDCAAMQAERLRIQAHMARSGGTYSHHEHGGNCMVCGSANAIYTVLFYHVPTNTYVRMGQDCAQKVEMGDMGDFNAFRTAVEDARNAQAGKRKAQAVLADLGLTRCWDLYANQPTFPGCECPYSCDCYHEWARENWKKDEQIVVDVVGKLVQYGNLSEKQTAFLGNLLVRIDNRPEREAAEKAAREAAADCPSGRIEIQGTVLSVKTEDDGPYGPTTRMLVQADAGYKVYGSRPSNQIGPDGQTLDPRCFERGDRVMFTATVQPSSDDPKFGFFKRPAKGRVLQQVAA